jgi:hypothetical protein
MYARPTSRVPTVGVLGRGRLRGLGMQAQFTPGGVSRSFGPIFARPFGTQGPGVLGPFVEPVTAPLTTSGSTAAEVAGTPVPVGYNRNTPFINSDGSQWEFSVSQDLWVNVGTPYQVNPIVPAPGTTSATASTGAQIGGTPVPVGYPTAAPYSDIYGNVWQFNTATGTWIETFQAGSAPAISPSGAIAPAAAPNVLTDSYTSILNWLTESSLLSPVPNWALVAGLGFVALKMMHPSSPARGKR